MPQRDKDIYAGAHLRRLQAEATAVLLPELQRCAGEHALLVSALPHDHPPVLPLLGHWVRLRATGDRFRGDLRARADEPLPFADDAFDLVLLRHAIETSPAPQPFLAEACRVLAPGGTLVLTGVHPLSAWAPWIYWHTRGQGKPLLRSPMTLERWVRDSRLDIERVIRVGHMLPNATGAHRGEQPGGGAFVLVARKQRRAAIPTRLQPKLVRAPVNVNLAPGARRHASS
ncbi:MULTISPECIES: class I SAM-dependent methyltransferase [Dyella]|uniref:Class I SAM-dependent methyltransferase n=2 Tax=Dyella TaxID=231454 RepID=A0A4R0YZF7_9GAMM|nr:MULTISPECIES: class I SAM-dependent methyltransferase [Dyella]TBR39684.1 class I SAM-dependent methyltransferase [Dyella terrae]TCI12734.1 class I SAM-dependent methyltransferase [Dyella soli]